MNLEIKFLSSCHHVIDSPLHVRRKGAERERETEEGREEGGRERVHAREREGEMIFPPSPPPPHSLCLSPTQACRSSAAFLSLPPSPSPTLSPWHSPPRQCGRHEQRPQLQTVRRVWSCTVCVCVCVHVWVCMYVCMYVCRCKCMCVYTYMYICVYIFENV
jgi:hypothetical protein